MMPTNPETQSSRTRRLLTAASLAALSSTTLAPLTQAAPPNILVLNIDDMGWADLAPYNTDSVQADTPTATRLAAEGLRFTNYYSASPICSPSRAGLLTGQYPSRWGINSFIDNRANNRLRDTQDFLSLNAPMITRPLQQAGYATANVGKWHLGGGRDVGYSLAPVVTDYGFDYSITQFEGLGNRVLYQNTNGVGLEGLSLASKNLGTRNGLDKIYEIQRDQSSSFFVDQAIDFIQQTKTADPAKPFFINLAFDDAHTPYDPKPELLTKYQNRYPSLPAAVKQYLAVVENLDTQIGRLVDAIDAGGWGADTLILLTADNGPSGPTYNNGSAGGLRGNKGSLYEGGIRSPLIARWTGRVDPGQVNSQTVITATDLFPSLASLAGAPAPANPDGQDLSAALVGDATLTRSAPIFWDYGRNSNHVGPAPNNRNHSPNLALRDGRYKLLIESDGTRPELYDLAADPNETTNLASQQPARVHSMARQTLAFRYQMPSIIPPESTTMVVHLRAENLAVADGTPIASFPDAKNGDTFNGTLSQSTPSARPTLRTGALNGRNALQFDGDDVLLSPTANSLPTPTNGLTLFLVATADQSNLPVARAAQIGLSAGTAGRVAGLDLSNETGLRFNDGAATHSPSLGSDFHIFAFRIPHGMTYANATMFIDGTTAEHTFAGSSSNPSSLTNFSGSTLELLLGTGRLANGSLATSDFYKGQIAELLVYNEQMTELEINLVANYLSSEYNLPFAYDTLTAIPEPTTLLPLLTLTALTRRLRRRRI
jgi:arylsulfatase A-like enzyme